MATLPGLDADVFFGDVAKPLPDWRPHAHDEDHDDDDDEPLSPDERAALVGVLGFDPTEWEDGSDSPKAPRE